MRTIEDKTVVYYMACKETLLTLIYYAASHSTGIHYDRLLIIVEALKRTIQHVASQTTQIMVVVRFPVLVMPY
jgi:hypothetical protein